MKNSAQQASKLIYLTPAISCAAAMLFGIIPCVLCLNGELFAYLSVITFLISILFHIYIIVNWKQYSQHSPLAYAIVQPCNHLVIMCIALTVGSTSICNIPTSEVKSEKFKINRPANFINNKAPFKNFD